MDTARAHVLPLHTTDQGYAVSPVDPSQGLDRTSNVLLPPPLLVALTGYRLLSVCIITSFGVAKAVLSYRGQSAIPTTLDWILGVVFTIGLYWLGLYESVHPPTWPWFFHTDYSRAIAFVILRFLGVACFVFIHSFVWPTAVLVFFLPCFFTYVIVTLITTKQVIGWVFAFALSNYYTVAAIQGYDFPYSLVLRLARLKRPLSKLSDVFFQRVVDKVFKRYVPLPPSSAYSPASHAYTFSCLIALPSDVFTSGSYLTTAIDILGAIPGGILGLSVHLMHTALWLDILANPLLELTHKRMGG